MRARVGLMVVALVVAACGGGDDGASAERLCEVQAEIAAIPMLAGDTPDELRAAMTDVRALFDELVDAAPDDARAAAESSRASAVAIIDVFAAVDYDADQVSTDELNDLAAGARDGSADLLAWAAANCEA